MKMKIFPSGQGKAWGSDFRVGERLTLKGKRKIRESRKSKKLTKVGLPPFLYYEEDTFGEGPSLGSQCVSRYLGWSLTEASKPKWSLVKWTGKWLFEVGKTIQRLFSFGEVDFTKNWSEWDCFGGQWVVGAYGSGSGHGVREHMWHRLELYKSIAHRSRAVLLMDVWRGKGFKEGEWLARSGVDLKQWLEGLWIWRVFGWV